MQLCVFRIDADGFPDIRLCPGHVPAVSLQPRPRANSQSLRPAPGPGRDLPRPADGLRILALVEQRPRQGEEQLAPDAGNWGRRFRGRLFRGGGGNSLYGVLEAVGGVRQSAPRLQAMSVGQQLLQEGVPKRIEM